MSDLHNLQKSLADRLNIEFEDSNAESSEMVEDQVVIGLAKRAQEKEEAEEKARSLQASAKKKKTFRPIGIALVMFAFAAVIIAGETIL